MPNAQFSINNNSRGIVPWGLALGILDLGLIEDPNSKDAYLYIVSCSFDIEHFSTFILETV